MAKKFLTPIDLSGTVNDSIDSPERHIKWIDDQGTLQLGLNGNNVKLAVGQEEVALCKNDTGSTLLKGRVVYVSGSQGQKPKIALSSASSESTSSKTFGVVAETIQNGEEGFVTTFGLLRGINTSSFLEGDLLWLSTTAGLLTKVRPSAPNNAVFVGYCIRSHASSGEIFVNIQNGYEIDELHNVLISNPVGGHVLKYDSATGVWTNGGIEGASFEVFYQPSAPSNPQLGDIWVDSDENLTEYDSLNVSNVLPTQTGNSGKYLTTDGSNPLWQSIDLSIYATKSSPTFTGTPLAPTAAVGTNTTQIATTEFVRSELANLVAAAPSTLDTLDELAAALGDDQNFATTVTNSIATKEPVINPGTTSQYWRGDKTWQTLNKSSVGLSNVENTALSTWPGTSNISTIGNVNSGNITIQSNAQINTSVTNITNNVPITISSLSISSFRSAEYLVQVSQGSKHTVSKLIMVHDGVDVYLTEYSIIEVGTPKIPLSITAEISSNNVVIQALINDATTNNAIVKVVSTAIVI